MRDNTAGEEHSSFEIADFRSKRDNARRRVATYLRRLTVAPSNVVADAVDMSGRLWHYEVISG